MDRKVISVREFWELGLLQEANRLFFHPRGLALSVSVDMDTGDAELGPVLDFRDTPGGVMFGDIAEDSERETKAARVGEMLSKNIEYRDSLFGGSGGIQPLNFADYDDVIGLVTNDTGVNDPPALVCPLCGRRLVVDGADALCLCYDCGAVGTYQELRDMADSVS